MGNAASCVVCLILIIQDPYQGLGRLSRKDACVDRRSLGLYGWYRPDFSGTDSDKKAEADGVGLIPIIQDDLLTWVSSARFGGSW